MALPGLHVTGEILQRIDPHTVFCNFKMEMGTAGNSSGTGDAQHIPLIHPLSHRNGASAHMRVEGGISAAM